MSRNYIPFAMVGALALLQTLAVESAQAKHKYYYKNGVKHFVPTKAKKGYSQAGWRSPASIPQTVDNSISGTTPGSGCTPGFQVNPIDPKSLENHTCTPNDKDMLTAMVCIIYHEARSQSFVGMQAVGQSVMQRLFTPPYPSTVSGNAYARGAYSGMRGGVHLTETAVLPDVVAAAKAAITAGGNCETNYYSLSGMPGHKPPYWAKNGQCQDGPGVQFTKADDLHFCPIGVAKNRTLTEVAKAEGLINGNDGVVADDGRFQVAEDTTMAHDNPTASQ